MANQLKFLVAHTGELFGDLHHRAVEFADHPALAIGVGAVFSHVTLAPAQIHQPLEPLRQAAFPNQQAVVGCLLRGLALQQLLHHLRGQAAGHGAEQAQGEMLTAVGELAPAGRRDPPTVGGAARALRRRAGFHQTLIF